MGHTQTWRWTLAALVGAVAVADAPAAHAQYGEPRCGGTLGGMDGVTVLGQDPGSGALVVCNRSNAGVVTSYLLTGCNATTPSNHFVRLAGGGSYYGPASVGRVVEPRGISCGGRVVLPWPATFRFGLYYTGYAGKDTVYGTPNNDQLFSNAYVPGWTNDRDNDTLCGYGGNDLLVGDYAAGYDPVCMNGGGGFDECRGELGAPVADSAFACELLARVLPASTDVCRCGTSQPPLWPLGGL